MAKKPPVEAVKVFLRGLGIKEVEYTSNGTVKPREHKYKMIAKKVEVVGESRKRIRPELMVQQFIPLFCIFGFEPWCWVRKYQEPKIDFEIHALEVDDVDVHLLKGDIEGTIITRFFNKSEEGKTWLENVKTGERREERTIEGSADLSGKFDESILIKKLNEVLAEIKNKVDRTRPKMEVRINSRFKHHSYWDMVKNIFKILISGKMNVDDDIQITVYWNWLGEEHSRTYNIHIEAELPVGEVRWHLT